MRFIVILVALVASAAQSDGYELKGDSLGVSLDEWREKHRHVSQEYQGEESYAPMCSDTSPKNPSIQPLNSGVGEVVCELYYPYQRKTVTVANVEASIRYHFNTNQEGHEAGNGLRAIFVTFESDYFDKLRDALISKWGEPELSTKQRLTNSFGAEFEGELLLWTSGSHQMALKQYSGSLDNSSLFLFHKELNAEMESRKSGTPNPDASDL